MEKGRIIVAKKNLETNDPIKFRKVGSAKIAANASIDELPPPGIGNNQLLKEKQLVEEKKTDPNDEFSKKIKEAADEFEKRGGRLPWKDSDN